MSSDERALFRRTAGDLESDVAVLDRLEADCRLQRDALIADSTARGPAAILALNMHDYYTAVESSLERAERLLASPPPPGPAWHQELLWGASRLIDGVRPAIISPESARSLDKLRSFRHFLRHAYAVFLEPDELLRTVEFLISGHQRVHADLTAFIDLLRRMAEDV